MKKTAAPIEISYAEGTDAADAPAITKAMAEDVRAELLDIDASQLSGGAEGQLVIAQPGDVAAFKAMSGDVTMNKSGVTQIGNSKIATGMLVDANVTDAKLVSPNNSAFKYLWTADSFVSQIEPADGFFNQDGKAGVSPSETVAFNGFYFRPADFTVASKTVKAKLSIQVQCTFITGSINPTKVDFQLFKLNEVTLEVEKIAASKLTMEWTTANFTGLKKGVSGEFELGEGLYGITFTTQAGVVKEALRMHAQVGIHHV